VAQQKAVSRPDQPRITDKGVKDMTRNNPGLSFNRSAIKTSTSRSNRNYGRS
jgi:hypothetical protein